MSRAARIAAAVDAQCFSLWYRNSCRKGLGTIRFPSLEMMETRTLQVAAVPNVQFAVVPYASLLALLYIFQRTIIFPRPPQVEGTRSLMNVGFLRLFDACLASIGIIRALL